MLCDMPPKPRWLADSEQHAWRSFLQVHGLLTARLNRAMQSASGLSLADFAVLVILSEHPARQMRVLELARRLGWEKSRVSHQLRRMGERGLVERARCGDDRRGSFIVLTDAGLAAVRAAAPMHVAEVRRSFFDALTEEDVADLARISDAAIAAMVADCAESAC
jgi:DNA-binding MarR family transcriptional regulator